MIKFGELSKIVQNYTFEKYKNRTEIISFLYSFWKKNQCNHKNS